MLLELERILLMEYGKKMIQEGLTRGTGGNLSVCDSEHKKMAITPSGIDYFSLKPEDIVILDIPTGKIIEGSQIPSSESDMHRIFYKYRKDISALVHTHSKYATAVSCLEQDGLPAIDYLLASAGTYVPCAEYATYGTVALARNAYKAMEGKKAVLLSNHGAIAGGNDLAEAYHIAETVEFCSEIYCISKSCGSVKILPEEEMKHMMIRFQNYGKRIEEHDEI